MAQTGERAVVGVTPAREHVRRGRLLDAFEQAYPVRFQGRDAGAVGGLDALVCFPTTNDDHGPPAHLPCLRYLGEERERGLTREVSLTRHPSLARPLWGSRLTEAHGGDVSSRGLGPGEVALARVSGAPAWRLATTRSAARHDVSIAPAELGEGDALRSRLAPARCLAVLALTQFIRNLTADRDWETPGTRAAFVIDDPNLRRPTYGHIRYAELAASAAARHYHVSIAMVPLDGRRFHGEAVRLFRRHQRQMSLCIHGNDHLRDEFGRPRSLAEGRVAAAQAIRRSIDFERRTGLTIDRVMVAPHERLGELAAEALLACGFEGFSNTRPYPWLDSAHDLSWLSRPLGAGPLVGWRSAELVGAGLPALLRLDFRHPREELVIRAFLGQPLIMYGHDDLLRGGTEELERTVEEIGRVGEVRWQSLAGIARSSVATRRRGSTLEVRMLGRRIVFDVPAEITEVCVNSEAVRRSPATRLTITGPAVKVRDDEATGHTLLAVRRPGRVEVALDHHLNPQTVPAPPASVRSVVRRIAAEGRDRTRSKLTWASR
jgi:hypothetical protein